MEAQVIFTAGMNCPVCGSAAAIGTRWNVDRKLSPSHKLDVPVCTDCFRKDR